MGKTHWKKLMNPDYLGSYFLDPGQTLDLTITKIAKEVVIGPDGKKEECPVAHFKESGIKPMVLNATNCKTIAGLYGTHLVEDWVGKRIRVGAEKVKAFGEIVEALRVQKTVPTDKAKEPVSMVCADCGETIQAASGMSAEAIASGTTAKYGAALCVECGGKRKQKAEEDKTA